MTTRNAPTILVRPGWRPTGNADADARANGSVESDRRNFEFNNDPNGAANATQGFRQAGDAAQGRTGPTIDTTQSGQMGQIGQQTRTQQDMLAEALRAQAYGTGYNPAIAQLQQSTQAAQAQQRSVAAGSMGYDGAAARREAAFSGAQLGQQAVGQGRVLQAQQMAFGRDAYGAQAEGMREGDLANRAALQSEAIRQGQLSDEQRARNDAMTNFYLSEEQRVRQAQTGANQGFEAQDAKNKLGIADIEAGRRAYDQAMNQRVTAAVTGTAGSFAAGLATYPTATNNGSPQRKRNPEDPFDPGY